jgi:4-amino-4-deoxy-L-arabinose transferase-like glycosyltransferase
LGDSPETEGQHGAEGPSIAPTTDDASVPVRRVMMPAESGTRLRTWGMLVLALGLCVTPMLIELGRPDTTRTMEKITLTTSRETWTSYKAGDADALLVPTWNGRPRINKPPMTVWLTTLAWVDLDPATADSQTLIHRARLMAFALTLLALASTYWAGYSIGGVRCATMATLVAGTTYLLLRQARVASYDTHLLAWVTLSVACGLWAIRPLKPVNWTGRRVSGWAFAGLALGAAILTKGPLAIVFVAVPLATTIIVAPRRKLGNTTGLLFALLLGCLAAAPWYLYVMEKFANAADMLGTEYTAARQDRQPFWYYAIVIVLIFPWSAYFLGSLFQPFMRAVGEHRRRTLLGWLWFICVLGMLLIPDAKQYRYLVPLIPAVGVLVGQLWAYHAWLATQGLKDPGVNLLRVPHWVILIGASIALPAFIHFQPELIERGYIEQIELPGLPLWAVLSLGVVLFTLAVYGTVRHFRWKPVGAFIATVLWMVVATSVVQYSYAQSYHSVYPSRDDARRVAEAAGDLPVFYLYDPAQDPRDPPLPRNIEPDEEFLFYTGKQILPIAVDQVGKYVDQPICLMVRLDERETNVGRVTGHGFKPLFDFSDGRNIAGFTPNSRLLVSPAVASPQPDE